MSLLAWINLGLITGSLPTRSSAGQGVVMDIALGIVGALVVGLFFNVFGMASVAKFNLYSLVVAVAGAALLLVVYRAVSRRAREAGGIK
jgi:uncharacterized membrane protein YeaQ/YmgE (transglycosylase-associated protein family)